jgi:hypothetical protein
MKNELPCINCITLAICKSRMLEMTNQYQETIPDLFYIVNLKTFCSLIIDYITTESNQYSKPEKCRHIVEYLS